MPTKLEQIKTLLGECSVDERLAVLSYLRQEFRIHPIEDELNVQAEVILEAIHRASDLSIRGVRGLIAEASFEYYVVNKLDGWKAVSLIGDVPFDFSVSDAMGNVRVQVKMQRLERKQPKFAKRLWQQTGKTVYIVETDVISPKQNWTLIEVLDEGSEGTSALALGRWSDGRRNPPVLAMRWNGHDSRPSGNPQSRGLPTWFVVEEKYYECIMRSGLLAPDKLTLVRSFFPEK